MKGKLPLIIIGGLFVLIIVGWLVVKPMFEQEQRQAVSDLSGVTETVKGAWDGYFGYFFLLSQEFEFQLVEQGAHIDWGEDDLGDYESRIDRFNDGDIDIMPLPLNVYLQHGHKINWKGIVGFSIGESHGADAFVAFKDRIMKGKTGPFEKLTLNEMLDDSTMIWTYILYGSPMEYNLELLLNDVRLPQLEAGKNWRREAETVEEIWEKLGDKDGDVFGLWEPYVTKAKKKYGDDIEVVWSSAHYDKYITDMLFFSADMVKNKPQLVQTIIESYFQAFEIYQSDPERMKEEMADWANVDEDDVPDIMANIRWHNFNDNAFMWFGLKNEYGQASQQGVKNLILASNRVMLKRKLLEAKHQLKSPSSIINSSFLENLRQTFIGGNVTQAAAIFAEIPEADWNRMQRINLNLPQVNFGRGSANLQQSGIAAIDEIAKMLAAEGPYGNYRVEIWGCTPDAGDEALQLSQDRADMTKQQFVNVYRFQPDRMRAVGKGNTVPTKGLSPTRVEIHLLRSF